MDMGGGGVLEGVWNEGHVLLYGTFTNACIIISIHISVRVTLSLHSGILEQKGQ